MRTILTLTVLAAGLTASPALAQSASPSGFYVGALGGYQGLDVEAADGSVSADADSAVYGVNAGYDLSLGSLFVGVEGELSTSSGSTEFPDSFTGAREGLEANGQYYIGARAGVALTPGIAAYGKVGYTALDTKAFTSAGTLDELEDNAGGLRFGGFNREAGLLGRMGCKERVRDDADGEDDEDGRQDCSDQLVELERIHDPSLLMRRGCRDCLPRIPDRPAQAGKIARKLGLLTVRRNTYKGLPQ